MEDRGSRMEDRSLGVTNYEALKGLDHTYLWHPFTQMKEWMGEDPCIIDRGDGHYLVDVHGRKYLDGVSSLWCNVHGHRKKRNSMMPSTLSSIASPPPRFSG